MPESEDAHRRGKLAERIRRAWSAATVPDAETVRRDAVMEAEETAAVLAGTRFDEVPFETLPWDAGSFLTFQSDAAAAYYVAGGMLWLLRTADGGPAAERMDDRLEFSVFLTLCSKGGSKHVSKVLTDEQARCVIDWFAWAADADLDLYPDCFSGARDAIPIWQKAMRRNAQLTST